MLLTEVAEFVPRSSCPLGPVSVISYINEKETLSNAQSAARLFIYHRALELLYSARWSVDEIKLGHENARIKLCCKNSNKELEGHLKEKDPNEGLLSSNVLQEQHVCLLPGQYLRRVVWRNEYIRKRWRWSGVLCTSKEQTRNNDKNKISLH